MLQTVIYKGLYGIDRFFLKEIKNVMFHPLAPPHPLPDGKTFPKVDRWQRELHSIDSGRWFEFVPYYLVVFIRIFRMRDRLQALKNTVSITFCSKVSDDLVALLSLESSLEKKTCFYV